MTAPGLKARPNSDASRQEAFCRTSRTIRVSTKIRIECDPDLPPRLCRQDLQDPERFHQRLVEWLLRQR